MVEINDRKEILNEVRSFYEKMNTEQIVDEEKMNQMINNISVKLNVEEKNDIEGPLTEYECACALRNMNNNKSPGSDGITTEFYKIFWNDIKSFYIKSLNYSFENGSLTTLQKQGIISLLPKKDKNLDDLKNWRPLTLLNTDVHHLKWSCLYNGPGIYFGPDFASKLVPIGIYNGTQIASKMNPSHK